MIDNEKQPRVPAGRREGGQFSTTDKGGQTQDLTTTYCDSAMVDAIVAAGAEAHVSGITAERVSTYLRTVGRNDLLAPDEAAMRLTPWKGFNARGLPLRRKSTCLSKEQENWLVEATDEKPVRTFLTRKEQLGQPTPLPPWEYVRLTAEGRRVALENLLLEAHDTQALAAQRLGFSDDVAEDYAVWAINYRLAEATRNLGKSDKMTLDLFAATVLTNSIEKYLTRPVPKPDEDYLGVARLGRAYEGTNRVGTDFTKFVSMLKPRNAETEASLWDNCARMRMDEALDVAWNAQVDKVKVKFGVEPISYTEFYDPYAPQSRGGVTPLNYRPAKENPQRLAEIRKLATSGDRLAMATVAAWDAAIKSAGSHNATLLSDGRSSTPFARNKVHRTIELPYKPESMSVEGTRRGARYIYRYTNGLAYYKDGSAQFRNTRPVSLNKPVGPDDNAAEFGDLLVGFRAGGSYRERAAVDPAEIYDAGQHYASAAAIAKALPDDAAGDAKLCRLLDIDLHENITDERARAIAITRDITAARAEGVPEDVICRLWESQWVKLTNAIAQRRSARSARLKAENEAAKARLRTLAAQRRAAQPAR